MERIAAADDSPSDSDERPEQYERYEQTFRALEDASPSDDDEGIAVVADRIENGKGRPSSRDARRRAVKFCRQNGYDVTDNDRLGA